MSPVVCATGLGDYSAGLSSFVKDMSSIHRSVLGCWYFLSKIYFKAMIKKKGVDIFLADDLKKNLCYFKFRVFFQNCCMLHIIY